MQESTAYFIYYCFKFIFYDIRSWEPQSTVGDSYNNLFDKYKHESKPNHTELIKHYFE